MFLSWVFYPKRLIVGFGIFRFIKYPTYPNFL
jgi:pimeloyl-ACP methyl ester carboxylesterase